MKNRNQFSIRNLPAFLGKILLLATSAYLLAATARADGLSLQRQQTKAMLHAVSDRIQKEFYDPNMRGVDWKSLTSQADKYIDNAKTPEEMITAIFALVDKLQDSHTVFIPPQFVKKPLFGFEAKAFGDEVRIYKLTKDGAAAEAGLQLGDRILAIDNFAAERRSFDKMILFFRLLRPVSALDIVYVRGKDAPKTLRLQAKVKVEQKNLDFTNFNTFMDLVREAESEASKNPEAQWNKYDDGISYLKLRSFEDDEEWFRNIFGKIKDSRAVVLDLRGNPGGILNSMKYVAGFFESEKSPIADLVSRKKTESVVAEPHSPSFSGPLYILVDSETASAGEAFARHFQLEKRAVIIGDHTSGHLTAAKIFPDMAGVDSGLFFATEVTVARFVFPGGEEVEGKGVTPDQVCIPTANDLHEERDVCRNLAVSLARKALGLPEEPASGTAKKD